MDNKLTDIVNEYLSLGINQQLDYEKFYLYSIITHSTAIEGSTVTEIENQLLFDEGISSNKPITEQLMNLDLKKAYEQSFIYAKNHEKITVALLCNLSSISMKNTGSVYNTMAGSYSKEFLDFMLEHHIENLKKQVEEYKSSIEAEDLKGGQKTVSGGQKKWSETTLKILELIKQNPKISRKELCDELKINPSAIQKHIEKLKTANVIERIGGAKGGEWRINE